MSGDRANARTDGRRTAPRLLCIGTCTPPRDYVSSLKRSEVTTKRSECGGGLSAQQRRRRRRRRRRRVYTCSRQISNCKLRRPGSSGERSRLRNRERASHTRMAARQPDSQAITKSGEASEWSEVGREGGREPTLCSPPSPLLCPRRLSALYLSVCLWLLAKSARPTEARQMYHPRVIEIRRSADIHTEIPTCGVRTADMRFHICTRAMLLLASTSKTPSCPGQSKLQRGMFSSLPPGLVWSPRLPLLLGYLVRSLVTKRLQIRGPLSRSQSPSVARLLPALLSYIDSTSGRAWT